MRKPTAAIASSLFFLLAPCVVAGVVPWWLTGWRVRRGPYELPLWIVAALLIVAGAAVLVHAFTRFVLEGAGTPAPVAPTDRLVVGGLYRYVRNPMYLAVLAILVAQILIFGQTALVWYTAFVAAAFVTFVRLYEEPTLRRKFGAQYDAYRRAVPGWWPRLHPWVPSDDAPPGPR
jgi:protein-S-isoprenylcysteine O-methyltransferase Ste14